MAPSQGSSQTGALPASPASFSPGAQAQLSVGLPGKRVLTAFCGVQLHLGST